MRFFAPQTLTLLLLASGGLVLAKKEEGPKPVPWSFAPLQRTALPKVKDTSWPKTRIDYYILAKMEAAGLKPAPRAEARVLQRRLSFDLTGLPPSEKSDESDTSDQVRQLLASPHYGERWARHWLDLARYVDQTPDWLDSTKYSYLYRDWVVQALNEDMPYDRFVVRQLATDFLSECGPKDRVALGFIGLSPTYFKELQLPPEIIKTTVADEWEEHVDAIGRTFLGLTLACARCHDHKSDPITAQDYYALAGVFAPDHAEDVGTQLTHAAGHTRQHLQAILHDDVSNLRDIELAGGFAGKRHPHDRLGIGFHFRHDRLVDLIGQQVAGTGDAVAHVACGGISLAAETELHRDLRALGAGDGFDEVDAFDARE